MFCYRCGSYNSESQRRCAVCGESFRLPEPLTAGGTRVAPIHREPPPAKPDELYAGRYRILTGSSQGVVGWVLRARDEEVDVDVALKVINPKLLSGLAREEVLDALRSASQTHHPNLARIYDVGVGDRDTLYYTMTLLEGLNLRRIADLRLERGRTFSLDEVLPILAQVSQGLTALRPRGGHMMLRPTCMFVMPETVKLTGYAHARTLTPGLLKESFIRFSATPYVAPEVLEINDLQALKDVSPTADVYSLGRIFAELVTGVNSFDAPGKHARALNALPPVLSGALQRAVDQDPERRYPDSLAFFNALAELPEDVRVAQKNAPATPRRPTPPPPPVEALNEQIVPPGPVASDPEKTERKAKRKRRAFPWWWVWGAFAVLMLVGVGSLCTSSESDRGPIKVRKFRPKGESAAEVQANKKPAGVEQPEVTDPKLSAIEPTRVAARPEPKPEPKPKPEQDPDPSPEPKTEVKRSGGPLADPAPPEATKRSACLPNMALIRSSGPFCIDRYEYPNRSGASPGVSVTWSQAVRLCEDEGKRLCAAEEWERACRGPRRFAYPFGNRPSDTLCNTSEQGGDLASTGSFEGCQSGYGVFDQAGNAAEWTVSDGPKGKIVKGGNARQSARRAACAASVSMRPNARSPFIGFRCCHSVE